MSSNKDANTPSGSIVITPTVGRVVYYHEEFEEIASENQPLAAMITYAHGIRSVNLVIFMRTGQSYGVTNVKLLQDGDLLPALNERYCYWPDYVIEQIRKSVSRNV